MMIIIPDSLQILSMLRGLVLISARDHADLCVSNAKGVFNPDGAMDLCRSLRNDVTALGGREITPVSTFAWVYEAGAVLKPHVDRPGLDTTVTLPLDRLSSVWPIHVEGKPFTCGYGEGIVLRGREQKHWREPAKFGPSIWLMLHYTDV